MDKEPEETQVAVVETKPRKHIIEEKFAPCLKVTLPDKRHVMVPIDKLSSDAKRQILVAMAREFVVGHLQRLSTATLTPAEVKDLVRAVTDVDSLQKEQYLASAGPPTTALGRQLQHLVHDVAKGAASGSAAAFIEKAKQMDAAAKRVEHIIET